jgi:hypothetical protein
MNNCACLRVPAVAAVLLALAFAGTAPAQPYLFTKIVDNAGPVDPAVNPPSINAGGTVAFVGAPDVGGLGIFTSNGGPTTTIADLSGPFNGFSDPFINSGGTVAFFANLDLGGVGIFTGSGGPTATIADTTGQFGGLGSFPSIDADGRVAFSATLASGSGIFAGVGGPTTTLYNTAGPFSEVFDPTINPIGLVSFKALLDGGGEGIFIGNGGQPNTIADIAGQFSSLGGLPVVVAGGTVAFRANLDLGGEGIFTGSGGPTSTIADTAGPFVQFFDPAFNAGGDVAFRAFLDAGGSGIFTGPDPASDAVIRTGDTLFGGTVTTLGFSHKGLNDSGQVVFYYELDNLANGVRGIAVATPVPEPTSLLLGLFGAGMLGSRRRWA